MHFFKRSSWAGFVFILFMGFSHVQAQVEDPLGDLTKPDSHQGGTLEIRPAVVEGNKVEPLTILGTGLSGVTDAILMQGGIMLPPVPGSLFIESDTQLRVSFDLTGQPPGPWALGLMGDGFFLQGVLLVGADGPVITSVSPPGAVNVGVRAFSVAGKNFDSITGAELIRDGTILSPETFEKVDDEHINVSFNLENRPIGLWNLRLKGDSTPEISIFVENPPPPAIYAVSPPSALNQGTVSLKISGLNFQYVTGAELRRQTAVLAAGSFERLGEDKASAVFNLAGLEPGTDWRLTLLGRGGAGETYFTVYEPTKITEVSPSAVLNRGIALVRVKGTGLFNVAGAELVMGQEKITPFIFYHANEKEIEMRFDFSGRKPGAWTLRLTGRETMEVPFRIMETPPFFKVQLSSSMGMVPGRPTAYYLFVQNYGEKGVALVSLTLPEGVELVSSTERPFFQEENVLLFAFPTEASAAAGSYLIVRLNPEKVLFPGEEPRPGKTVAMGDSVQPEAYLKASLKPEDWADLSKLDMEALFKRATGKSFERWFQFYLDFASIKNKEARIQYMKEIQLRVSPDLARSVAAFHVVDKAIQKLQGGDPADPPQDEDLAEFLKRQTSGEIPYLKAQVKSYQHIFKELAKRGRARIIEEGEMIGHYMLLDSEGNDHMEFKMNKQVEEPDGSAMKSPRTGKKMRPDKAIIDHKKKKIYITDPVACTTCEHSRKNLDYGEGMKKQYPGYEVAPPQEWNTQKRKLYDSQENVDRLSKRKTATGSSLVPDGSSRLPTPDIPGQQCLIREGGETMLKEAGEKGAKTLLKEIPIFDILVAFVFIANDPTLDTIVEEVGGAIPVIGTAWSIGYSIGKELRGVEIDGATLEEWSERVGQIIGERGWDQYLLKDVPEFYTGVLSDFWEWMTSANKCPPPGANIVASWDPNELYAIPPAGPIQGTEEIIYRVQFENLAAASADAEDVTVTVDLDPDVKPAWVKLRGSSHPGAVTAEVTGTGQIRWRFEDIHLPPNQTPPEGEGWVEFSIALEGSLPSGTELSHQARIVFDFNPPIETGVVLHRIDRIPPQTALSPEAEALDEESGRYRLDWSGADDPGGSGLAQVRFYAATEGKAYVLFHAVDAPGSSGTVEFKGDVGASYSFIALGVDQAGNREPSPLSPDAMTALGENQREDLGGSNPDDFLEEPQALTLQGGCLLGEGGLVMKIPSMILPLLPVAWIVWKKRKRKGH